GETPMGARITPSGWEIDLPEGIPLEVDHFPVKIGPVHGRSSPEPKFETSLSVPPISLDPLAQGLCLDQGHRTLPARLRVDFPRLEIAPGSIDPTGTVHLDLFD